MLSISFGPLALPVSPLLWLAALFTALFVARRVAHTAPAPAAADAAAQRAGAEAGADAGAQAAQAAQAESALWWAALAGLLTARALHLALNTQAYLATPWAMLDLRDGGWHPAAGLAGLVAVLWWRARRQPWLRPALRTAVLAGGVAWGLGQGVLWVAGGPGTAPGAPAVALQPFSEPGTAPGATPAPGLSATPAAGVGPAVLLPELIAGRPAVVNLWASWCGPCRAEMPVLAAAQRAHPEVRFVFVNQGESAAAVQAYLRREGLALQDVWLDPASQLGPAVGSGGLPTTLFYDAQGQRVHAHMGVLNAAALQARLRELRGR